MDADEIWAGFVVMFLVAIIGTLVWAVVTNSNNNAYIGEKCAEANGEVAYTIKRSFICYPKGSQIVIPKAN